jgi:hypothetical protein
LRNRWAQEEAVSEQKPDKDGCNQAESYQSYSQGLLDLIEKRRNLAGAGFKGLFQAAEFVSQVKAGHDSDTSAVCGGRAGCDGMHQVVHRLRGVYQFLRVALGKKRVRLVEDRYFDWLAAIHLLAKSVNMPKQLLDAGANLLAFRT